MLKRSEDKYSEPGMSGLWKKAWSIKVKCPVPNEIGSTENEVEHMENEVEGIEIEAESKENEVETMEKEVETMEKELESMGGKVENEVESKVLGELNILSAWSD